MGKHKKEESCGSVTFNVYVKCAGKKKCKCDDKKDHDKDCKKHEPKCDDKKIEQVQITGITGGDIKNIAKP